MRGAASWRDAAVVDRRQQGLGEQLERQLGGEDAVEADVGGQRLLVELAEQVAVAVGAGGGRVVDGVQVLGGVPLDGEVGPDVERHPIDGPQLEKAVGRPGSGCPGRSAARPRAAPTCQRLRLSVKKPPFEGDAARG